MADVDVSITNEDLTQVLRDNPLVTLQLQVKALTRTCQEQAERLASLESELVELRGNQSVAEEGD